MYIIREEPDTGEVVETFASFRECYSFLIPSAIRHIKIVGRYSEHGYGIWKGSKPILRFDRYGEIIKDERHSR